MQSVVNLATDKNALVKSSLETCKKPLTTIWALNLT